MNCLKFSLLSRKPVGWIEGIVWKVSASDKSSKICRRAAATILEPLKVNLSVLRPKLSTRIIRHHLCSFTINLLFYSLGWNKVLKASYMMINTSDNTWGPSMVKCRFYWKHLIISDIPLNLFGANIRVPGLLCLYQKQCCSKRLLNNPLTTSTNH